MCKSFSSLRATSHAVGVAYFFKNFLTTQSSGVISLWQAGKGYTFRQIGILSGRFTGFITPLNI
jgi:hypothetical protein